jgi:hypothetical protein
MSCGKKIQRSDDFFHVRGGVVHASCSTPSLFRKSA